MPKFSSDVELHRSAHLYESDMAAESLAKAGIPFYRIQEDVGGVQSSLVMPPQGGIGLQFLIIVPAELEEKARAIVDSLPILQNPNPGFYECNSSKAVRKWYRIYAWIALIFLAIALIVQLTPVGKIILQHQ